MSINNFTEKVKSKLAPFYWLIFCVVIAAIFFALGRLSAIEGRSAPIRILQPENGQTASVVSSTLDSAGTQNQNTEASVLPNASTDNNTNTTGGGQVVASKNGTKYYFPWCGGVKNIKPENLVTFASSDLARAAGYTPAGNCKGLK